MKISFIGAGNMASAIAKGALKSNLLPQKTFYFYDIQVENRRFCTRNWHAVASPQEAITVADLF